MTVFSRVVASTVLFVSLPFATGAETLTWGQIEFKAGSTHVSNIEGEASSIDDRNPTGYDLAGRIGADWGAFGAQLDLNYSGRNIDPTVSAGYYWGRFGTLRANYDISSALTLGAAYGAGDAAGADDDQATFDFYALEGAYSAGAGVYGLQLGTFDASDPQDTDAFHDGSFARASTIYTLGNGSVVEGALAYFDGKQDASGIFNMHAYTWSVEYSQQIGANPLAWSVGLDGGKFKNGDDGDNGSYNETRVTLGLTAWFGDSDLGSAKRRGIFSDPEFGRIIQAGNNVD